MTTVLGQAAFTDADSVAWILPGLGFVVASATAGGISEPTLYLQRCAGLFGGES